MSQVLSFLRARLARDAITPIESSESLIPLAIGLCPIGASELSYEERLLRAQRIAAEVRHRKGWDKYYNGAPKRDLRGEIIS